MLSDPSLKKGGGILLLKILLQHSQRHKELMDVFQPQNKGTMYVSGPSMCCEPGSNDNSRWDSVSPLGIEKSEMWQENVP